MSKSPKRRRYAYHETCGQRQVLNSLGNALLVADRGFDLTSFKGTGASAQLFINEVKFATYSATGVQDHYEGADVATIDPFFSLPSVMSKHSSPINQLPIHLVPQQRVQA